MSYHGYDTLETDPHYIITLKTLRKLYEEKDKPWLIALAQEDYDVVFDEIEPIDRMALELILRLGINSFILPPIDLTYPAPVVVVSPDVEQGKPLFLH